MKKFFSFVAMNIIFTMLYPQEILSDSIRINLANINDSILNLENELPSPISDISTPAFITSYTISNYKYTTPTGYLNTYNKQLSNNLLLSVIGKSDVWHGITTINSAHFDLHYQYGRFGYTLGSSLWKYDDHNLPNRYRDIAFNMDISYMPLNWLTIGAYGQYAVLSAKNAKKGAILPTPMIPYSNFGGYSKIMFNSTFGIYGGIGMQYNPMLKKWETTYGFGPTFDFRRKKKK